MQNSSNSNTVSQTSDNTRAGGPDDTRDVKKPDRPEEKEEQPTREEQNPVYR
jgi:hypothetical protein